MQVNEIRSRYIAFFKERGHAVIPSASLVPQNDPTTLFTGSGMQPLIPYLLGEPHPEGARLVDSQKSFRAEDIEEVGDNRHTTFFEMLGNWSLGDYFKEEQLPWFFSFLTDELGIDPSRLYVTAYNGDEKSGIARDTESAAIWRRLFEEKGIEAKEVVLGTEEGGAAKGMQGGRIFYYDAKNWWSRAGAPEKMPSGEPGGPDSEVFYDFRSPHDKSFGEHCHPNCDCGRFLEIGNSVFMEFLKKEDGSFGPLPKKNVDFGGGLERIAAAVIGSPDVFRTDIFWDIILLLEKFSGKHYEESGNTKSFRIIADHMRAATFMLADGVRPSNTERGYIARRLIRRAQQHSMKLGLQDGNKEDSMLVRASTIIVDKYQQAYPELAQHAEEIADEIWKEIVQFGRTLEQGMKEFEKVAASGSVSGQDALVLFTTHGFPFEMTKEIAAERGIQVDEEGFRHEMGKHRELSRAGAEQKFKGGLADHSEKTTRLHTAHHLLLRALQLVLGEEVKQRGSNITQERLRIDFSYGQKMTKEQIAEVVRIVNEKIQEALPVSRLTIAKEEAEKSGAEREFGAKYPDIVSVYAVGKLGKDDADTLLNAFSKEFCGGPHVTNTRELGVFKIQKEEAVAAGIRRIKATLTN